MKTSRLKNIVIVILLLVNAFLLFLLLSRRAEERDSNERRVEQLCTLFEKNGVAFDRARCPMRKRTSPSRLSVTPHAKRLSPPPCSALPRAAIPAAV